MYVVYLKFIFYWDESANLTLGINYYLLYLYKAAFHKSPDTNSTKLSKNSSVVTHESESLPPAALCLHSYKSE